MATGMKANCQVRSVKQVRWVKNVRRVKVKGLRRVMGDENRSREDIGNRILMSKEEIGNTFQVAILFCPVIVK